MQIGMNDWCLPKGLTFSEKLALLRENQVDTIELNMSEYQSNKKIVETDKLGLIDSQILCLDDSEEKLNHLKSELQTSGMRLSSISTALLWKYPLNQLETQDKAIEIIKQMIRACSFLGGDTVLIVPAVVDEKHTYQEAWDNSKKALISLATFAEKYHVKIGIENVWNKFLLGPFEFLNFIMEIDSPYVGAYFDIGNVVRDGYPEQWITILKDKIFKVHIKNYQRASQTLEGFTASLLDGDVNWLKCMQALRKIGYDGPVTAEIPIEKIKYSQIFFISELVKTMKLIIR